MSFEDTQHIDRYKAPQPQPIKTSKHRILVMGIGGGGSNAVNHMYEQSIDGIEFVILNTDHQALEMSEVPNKLLIGPKTTKGLGAGGKPEVAKSAAEESYADIENLLDPVPNMVFITAGMGGGTGTGASPVVAKAARERGILTVGIVTIPFFFEGLPKIRKALRGADELGKFVDTLLVINNERLTEIYPNLPFTMAFQKADDILSVAARSISEIITTPIMINLDMRDVDSTLRDGKTALISVGYGEGEHRMTKAIQSALNSPLLRDSDVYTSKRLLFAFYFSKEIDPPYTAAESNEITQFIREMNLEVDVIWGYGYDETLGNQVKFSLLASGFDVTVDDDLKIEGDKTQPEIADDEDAIIKQVEKNYGSEKVEELQRQKETQNYILLNEDQLDNDEAIEMIERTPAYLRDKKTTTSIKASMNLQNTSSTAKQPQKSENRNIITFSGDDK